MKTEPLILDSLRTICMSNILLCGKSSLSINALKIVRIAIMQISENDTELKEYDVKVSDLMSFIDEKKSIYDKMSKIAVELSNESVELYNESSTQPICIIPWCDKCSYENETGIFKIRLHEDLKPYLLELKNNYTLYSANNIVRMKNIYAIKLYELLECNKAITPFGTDINISISDIRTLVIGADNYEKDLDIKKRIIENSLDEINRIANFKITYENIVSLDTRKIVAYRFLNFFNIQ